MIKKLFLLSVFVVLSIALHAQTKYTITKYTQGTVPTTKIGEFKAVTKPFTAILYSDALTFDDSSSSYFKFAREIVLSDGKRWKALDKNGVECTIAIHDYGTYTIISIVYPNAKTYVAYQTL
jgi:hypothetical protein